MKKVSSKNVIWMAIISGITIAVILVAGTIWSGRSASRDTDTAVRNVSLLYLGELAVRREQVVSKALDDYIYNTDVAVGLMDADDLKDKKSLQEYLARMKQLYNLEKFAFVDEDGVIYTSRGTRSDIDKYDFDYREISGAEISIKNIHSKNKTVIIAMPVDELPFMGKKLVVCFIEISMDQLLEGVSLKTDNSNTTFCNIYTEDGVALTNLVLGGLASEDNLLEAMGNANFIEGESLDGMKNDFVTGKEGVVSFTYNGIDETMHYVPIYGTDWMLTYLIRESVISEQISAISGSIIRRSLILSVVIAIALLLLFIYLYSEIKMNAKMSIEKEVAETESRMRQEELEEQKAMQEELSDALMAAEKANRAKSSFLSNMSHEIRTPITAVLGMNEMIQRESTDEDILSYSDNIKKAGTSLLGIINDILDFSKIESGMMEINKAPYDVKDFIMDTYNLIRFRAESKGLVIKFDIDPKLPTRLIGDELRVKQIVTNLLTNAVKYTEKGSVLFEIKKESVTDKGINIYFAVTDTGIGIRADEMEKLFNAFDRLDKERTRSIEGTGLGLSIACQMLALMGSQLKVESTYDVGSKFYFHLYQEISEEEPIGDFDVKATLREYHHENELASFVAPEARLLVVDDTPLNLQVISGLLKHTQMQIDTASDGAECIEKFRDHAD